MKKKTINSHVLKGVNLTFQVFQFFDQFIKPRNCLGYGMTELSPTSHFPSKEGQMKHGSGGMVLPNTECKIVDTESGKSLPVGQDGEVCVRGPQVCTRVKILAEIVLL